MHHFEAYLFRKRCTRFHQNRPSFIGDITENVLVSFFSWTQCRMCLAGRKTLLDFTFNNIVFVYDCVHSRVYVGTVLIVCVDDVCV